MKTCPNCGEKINDGDKFCMNCGARVVLRNTCSACGYEINDGDGFCMNCGAKIVRKDWAGGINFLFLQDAYSNEENCKPDKKPPKRSSQVEVRLRTGETPSQSAATTRKSEAVIALDNNEEYMRDNSHKRSFEEGKRPLMYYMVSNKRLSRAMNFGYLFFFLTVIGLIVCWALHTAGTIVLVSPHWIVLTGACGTLVFALIGYVLPTKSTSVEELKLAVMRKQEIDMIKFPIGNIVFMLIIILLWFLASVFLNMIFGEIYLRGYLTAMAFCLIATLLYVLGAREVAKRNAAMRYVPFLCRLFCRHKT